ncbi:hypothetical protein POPTR_005G015300v4 [Populus trichocarpa]|uniref:Uncharacterized protein n=1 Tax=Populus trichocarpa TaxID=3694 RepID=A0A2K2AA82_POPTR|nr:hypothetical protein POPTR_005G015300v4 [Populus trichocarpa]
MKNGLLPFGSFPIDNIPGAGTSEFFQEISRFTCPVYLLIPCFPPGSMYQLDCQNSANKWQMDLSHLLRQCICCTSIRH